jgi:excisionase family DNA binding protein
MSDEPTPSSKAADEFLTVAEIAKLLQLNQQTVRNMIDRGEPGAVRVAQGAFEFASRS